jgi:transposase
MVLDHGAFHKAKRLVILENLVFLFLPPYAPELNPIERLWQDIKEQISFPLFETLQDLKDAVAEILQHYSVQTIASLTGYHYLVNAIYALSD